MGNLNLKRSLVSQEDSAVVARPDVPRSRFVGAWTRKQTFDQGKLVPFMVEEVLPGDHLKYEAVAYVRMATPLYPLMDNLRVDTFFFFVPNRLVWANWEKFCGEQANPGDSIAYTIPKITVSQGSAFNAAGSLIDYFGFPVGNLAAAQTIEMNSLPLRAYNLIYNEWFRDQNLINSLTVRTTDSGDLFTDYTGVLGLQYRAKAHDYFTSCLPWPQKFTAPGVTLPVYGLGVGTAPTVTGPHTVYETDGTGSTSFTTAVLAATAGNLYAEMADGTYPDIRTEMSINAFREAFLVQSLLERDARGGTRYVEILKNHFGVTSADARLQRPEFIGGGTSPVGITPIAQTATGGGGLGSLGGAATAVGQHRASYASTEHGYIIGLINVRSELSYSQGLHKMWTRSTRYDFYWPSLAGLGEQAVLRQEIYCTGTDASDSAVFGYQERWHEYRTRVSEVAGVFRPVLATNIDEWHLSQQFSAAPTLGQTFIEDTAPMSRVLAAGASTNQQFLADILIKRDAVRPIPMYGTPATLGRF